MGMLSVWFELAGAVIQCSDIKLVTQGDDSGAAT